MKNNIQSPAPDGLWGRIGIWVNSAEETFIALLLGLMVVITFINVVLRYGFNTSLIWGFEVVLILFAWLVMFGIAYAFKITSHLGVDALVNALPHRSKRIMSLLAAAACILYAVLLLKGSWDFWAPFAALDVTSGRWFPIGFDETRNQAFYTTDQVPMLGIFRWLEEAINFGEEFEKLPRVVPYTMMPVASALILFRVLQASLRVLRGQQDSLIVSHEAEEAVEDAAATLREG